MRKAILFFIGVLLTYYPAIAETVTLTLKASDGVARVGEYVRRGVPLPINSGCSSTSEMLVTTATGVPVDAQFDVISRYDTDHDGFDGADPIRVVLVTFAATVDGTATYYFHTTGGGGNATGAPLVTDGAGYISINTGAMELRLKEGAGFNFIDRVTVDGTNIVSAPATDGIIARVGGVDYTSYHGTSAPTITVHYNGPIMACVSVAGRLEDADHNALTPPGGTNPVTYKVWYWLHKNSRTVYPSITIKNENDGYFSSSTYGTHRNFDLDYLYVRTTMAGMGAPSAIRIGPGVVDGPAFAATSPYGAYTIDQNHPAWTDDATTSDDFSVMSYAVGQVGSTTTEASDRWNSYADIRDANRGVMVSGRWFWQNYWKEIRLDATNKRIDFYLWADEATDHKFLGGTWKTHELQYNFHGNVAGDYNFSKELSAVNDKIRVYCSTEHSSNYSYRRPGPSTVDSFVFQEGEVFQDTINKAQDLREVYFDGSKSDSPGEQDWDDYRRFRVLKHASPGTFAGNYIQWYGWLDFGDGVRDTLGKGSQNYDWIWVALNAGLAVSDNYYMDLADQFVRHYGDLLIIHNPSASTAMASSGANIARVHGGQRGETDPLGHQNNFGWSNSGNEPANFGHTWYGGFLWSYLVSGDPWCLDVAQHMGDHVLYDFTNIPRHSTSGYSGFHCNVNDCYTNLTESRQYSPGIDAAINLYNTTGELQYLTAAIGIFDHAILNNEVTANGFGGFQLSPTALGAHTLYENIVSRNLIYLFYALKDANMTAKAEEVKSYLGRQAVYYLDMISKWTGCTPGTYTDGQYCPYQATTTWSSDPEVPNGTIYDRTYLVAASQVFAFLRNEGIAGWADVARAAWKDGMVYPTAAPTLLAPISDSELGGLGAAFESSWLKKAKLVQDSAFFLVYPSVSQPASGLRFGRSGTLSIAPTGGAAIGTTP